MMRSTLNEALGAPPADNARQRVVLITGHVYESRRRAGFHFLADAFHSLGWQVTFVTASLSWLSVLRRDHRLAYSVRKDAGRLRAIRPGLDAFVYFTALHPGNLRLAPLNLLSTPLFARYGRRLPETLEAALRDADLIVYESTPGLLLADRARRLNPAARHVYRVSDDLRLLRNHPAVLQAERRLAPGFDLVSVPSVAMTRLFPGQPNVRVDHHGLDLEAFEATSPSPYEPGSTNIVFAGNSQFDTDFLARAAGLFPSWTFHIIGPIPNLPAASNIRAYGERPFREVVPYVQHANAGLQTLVYRPGAESFTDSLKVLQYSYCGLGVVAPSFLASGRSNVFAYETGDDAGIAEALRRAVAHRPTPADRAGIYSWSHLAGVLAA